MSLKEKKVVIIGGSSGMGLATAKAAAAEGALVVIAGRSPEKLRQASDEIEAEVMTRPVDITQEAQVRDFFSEVGDMDHLVITAASGVTGRFMELDTPAFRQAFDSKFWGQYFAARYGSPWIRQGGSLTLFSGVAGTRPLEGLSSFAAVNGAVESLCRALALELAPLRVNVISPGIVDTPVYEGMAQQERKAFFEQIASKVPVGRVGRTEDIAQAVLFLMKNGYATGSVVHVDGGHRLV